MAAIDSGKRVMSGTHGYLWCDGELIAETTKFTAKYTATKEAVTFSGQMMEDTKTMGVKGTGSVAIQKVFSRFRDVVDAMARGEDKRVTFVSNLSDPDAYGAERVAIYNVSFDEATITDWEHKVLSKIETPFTFTDHKYLESVEAAT